MTGTVIEKFLTVDNLKNWFLHQVFLDSHLQNMKSEKGGQSTHLTQFLIKRTKHENLFAKRTNQVHNMFHIIP